MANCRVKLLLGLLCSAVIWFIGLNQVQGATNHEVLCALDASLRHGGLEVLYPEVDIQTCLIIPHHLRQKISQVWGAPQICLTSAEKGKKYALMMVDPDAPSRSNPSRAYWRHWLVVDIEGATLRNGNLRGTTLSEYIRPAPPQKTGLHRYQFMVFEQRPDLSPSLTKEEKLILGNWDPQGFILKYHLGAPVATVQFLTQNYMD